MNEIKALVLPCYLNEQFCLFSSLKTMIRLCVIVNRLTIKHSYYVLTKANT